MMSKLTLLIFLNSCFSVVESFINYAMFLKHITELIRSFFIFAKVEILNFFFLGKKKKVQRPHGLWSFPFRFLCGPTLHKPLKVQASQVLICGLY